MDYILKKEEHNNEEEIILTKVEKADRAEFEKRREAYKKILNEIS